MSIALFMHRSIKGLLFFVRSRCLPDFHQTGIKVLLDLQSTNTNLSNPRCYFACGPVLPSTNRSGFAYKWLLANFASLAMMVSKFTSTEGPVTVPTRNVNLTDELDRFVAKKVKTGRYENASEVVRAGLRTLEREEQQYEAKLAALRAAIDDGDASGVADGDVFVRVRKALKLPASSR
jgi:antitoxin ParD1/3/4